MSEDSATTGPKAFISYSWTSEAHQEQVRLLADRLLSDGVDVILDKYDLKEGQDLHQFMERMVTDPAVTHVLVVTDHAYAEKANRREKGVGKEALLISAEVYSKADQTKFIALVFETREGEYCVPAFLNGRLHIDMSTSERLNDNYEGLLRVLHGKPQFKKPALGRIPSFLLEATGPALPTASKAQLVRSAVLDGKPFAEAVVDDYFALFEDSLAMLQVPLEGTAPLDERVEATISGFQASRDEFVGLVEFLSGYRDTEHTYQAIFEFFERSSRYLAVQQGQNTDVYTFILGELFLHVVAALIRKKRFKEARRLIANDYRVPHEYQDKWQSFVVFFPATRSIDQDRQRRLNTDWVSGTAELLLSRAAGKPTTLEDLMQADLILFLQSLLDLDRTSWLWTPYTALHRQRSQPFDLFTRAESIRQFEALKSLFGIESRDEFVKRIAEAGRGLHFSGGTMFLSNARSPIYFAELANLAKLASRP